MPYEPNPSTTDLPARAAGDCGFRKENGEPCGNRAGKGTLHVGEGCCSVHGGKGGRPPKHGLYAQITRPRIRELLDAAAALENPLDLEPHVNMLQVLAVDFVERYDENRDALLRWSGSYTKEYARALAWAAENEDDEPDPIGFGRPSQILDISSASTLIGQLGAMVERIQKREERNSVSFETFEIALQLYAERVAVEVREVIDDPELRAELGRALNGKCKGFLDELLGGQRRGRR